MFQVNISYLPRTVSINSFKSSKWMYESKMSALLIRPYDLLWIKCPLNKVITAENNIDTGPTNPFIYFIFHTYELYSYVALHALSRGNQKTKSEIPKVAYRSYLKVSLFIYSCQLHSYFNWAITHFARILAYGLCLTISKFVFVTGIPVDHPIQYC